MNETPLLDHLLRAGLTPNFSFPLDVCEFTASGVENSSRRFVNAQQDLGKAEGMRQEVLVIDDIEYMVGGLALIAASTTRHGTCLDLMQEKTLLWFSVRATPVVGCMER